MGISGFPVENDATFVRLRGFLEKNDAAFPRFPAEADVVFARHFHGFTRQPVWFRKTCGCLREDGFAKMMSASAFTRMTSASPSRGCLLFLPKVYPFSPKTYFFHETYFRAKPVFTKPDVFAKLVYAKATVWSTNTVWFPEMLWHCMIPLNAVWFRETFPRNAVWFRRNAVDADKISILQSRHCWNMRTYSF